VSATVLRQASDNKVAGGAYYNLANTWCRSNELGLSVTAKALKTKTFDIHISRLMRQGAWPPP